MGKHTCFDIILNKINVSIIFIDVIFKISFILEMRQFSKRGNFLTAYVSGRIFLLASYRNLPVPNQWQSLTVSKMIFIIYSVF